MNRIAVLGLVAAMSAAVEAKVELGAPFADGMVLQRGMKVPVWGTIGQHSAPMRVVVEFAGQAKSAKPDPVTGAWRVDLDAMEASKVGRTLTVTQESDAWLSWFSGAVDCAEVKDVLVGEVWFASGQSNMECPIWHDGNSRYRDGKGAMMTQMTRLPCVRFVKTPRIYGTAGRNPLKAQWKKFEPASFVAGVDSPHWQLPSAVAWYYARELYLALDVPVGIVDSSIGGTNIDAWTPRAGYEDCDASLKPTADYRIRLGKEWKNEYARGPINGELQQPTVLFNAMVWDYAPMAMRGMIWYQGCHNSGEAELYCAKMHALYNGWARVFENENLKFHFAQLAPWKHNWMKLVAAQNRFAAEEPNASIAVTADVGNFDDIHPNDKETVAQRLVFQALKRDYGFDIPETDSPVFKGASFKNGVATLAFDHVKTWYVYNRDMSLGAPFEVAGADGVWHAAKLVDNGRRFEPWQTLGFIDRAELKVKSDEVGDPVAVRYLGRDRTSSVLYNQASLPLGAFETALPKAAAPDADGYTSIFDGKTLKGWKVRGGEAKFFVKDGEIVGEGVPSDWGVNTFITTERDYGDFDLKVEFFCESGNSGVQFRSTTRSEFDPAWDWNPFPKGVNKVFGYQAEITPNGGCVGRIYDEERRGYRNGIVWLDLNTPRQRCEAAEKSFRKGDWNEMRVRCEGTRVQTWLNGKPVADILDDMSKTGFIGLQVHTQGKPKDLSTFKPMRVRFRNVRIKELAAPVAPVAVLPLDAATAAKAFIRQGTNTLETLSFGQRTVTRLNGFEISDTANPQVVPANLKSDK